MEKIKKILVIDDVMHVLKVIECRLKASGYQVITEVHCELAFKKAKTEQPDLILLDIMMTEQNSGLHLLSKLKNDPATKNIPVIMLTASGIKTNIMQAISLGALDYIKKPFDSAVLLEKIKKAIG